MFLKNLVSVCKIISPWTIHLYYERIDIEIDFIKNLFVFIINFTKVGISYYEIICLTSLKELE